MEQFRIHVYRDYEPWYIKPWNWAFPHRKLLRHHCFIMSKDIDDDFDVIEEMNQIRAVMKKSGWEVEIYDG